MVLHLNESNFASSIANGVAVIDFMATWCGPCKQMAPIVEKIGAEQTDIIVGKIDVDESQEIAQKYNVLSIPTIIIFKDGEAIDQFIGIVQEKKLLEKINSLK